MRPSAPHTKPERGLSLIELLVGLALGLVLVSAALLAFVHQARETRSLLLEARLMQDLRITADLMASNLRRASHWAGAPSGVWSSENVPLRLNPHTRFTLAEDHVDFSHSPPGEQDVEADGQGQLGYRLRQGAVEMKMSTGPWQAMTDPTTMRITSLGLRASVAEEPLGHLCASACPSTAADSCPPRQAVKRIALHLRAVSAHDPTIQRELQSSVRLRNDTLIGSCPP
jgi:prepilin peptidase dependent protein B